MAVAPLATREDLRLRLAAFGPQHADAVAAWAPTPEALRWLAPSTSFPLTADGVCAWQRPHTRAFVLVTRGGAGPLGYGELNPMKADPMHFWLGHIVVDPRLRGRGLGLALVRRLLDVARFEHRATRVSLIVFPENRGAIRCYESAGFDRAGDEVHRFPACETPTLLQRYEWRP